MRRRLAACMVAVTLASPAHAAMLTGTVIGEGARPVPGAVVQVLRPDGERVCATNTGADGTFALPCSAMGRHAVRASFGDLPPWTIDGVELAPDGEVHLNFMLAPAAATAGAVEPASGATASEGFWTRRIPNPIVATWGDVSVTLRMLAIVVGVVSFPLGAFTMLALGRRFGVQSRRLSPDEVGDMVLNPTWSTVGQRVTPIATVGARGASATVSFSADEIAAAIAEKRWALVFASLVVAPAFFALASLGFAVALLVGQEAWLLYAMLLVPAGFVLTPIMIGIQALRR